MIRKNDKIYLRLKNFKERLRHINQSEVNIICRKDELFFMNYFVKVRDPLYIKNKKRYCYCKTYQKNSLNNFNYFFQTICCFFKTFRAFISV